MILDLLGLAAIITKFALYLGVITATGTVMATLIFRLDRTRGLAAAFAFLGLVATIFAFSLRGANLTGDASGMIDAEMLGLLWTTLVGTALMSRALGLILLMLGLLLGRIGTWISVLGGVIAVEWVSIEEAPIPGVALNTLLYVGIALYAPSMMGNLLGADKAEA